MTACDHVANHQQLMTCGTSWLTREQFYRSFCGVRSTCIQRAACNLACVQGRDEPPQKQVSCTYTCDKNA
eukprot:1723250-Amphidinium_carterae.1